MSRDLERSIAKRAGVPHSIFNNTDDSCPASSIRKQRFSTKEINAVGLGMRKELLGRGWKAATERQAWRAMELESPEFRCTAISCGCVGQEVELRKADGYIFHSGHRAWLFNLRSMAYEYGIGKALLISPATRKAIGVWGVYVLTYQ